MACKDCYNNCGNQTLSDECVKYTGEEIPLLGICNGDPLIMIEEILIEKILTMINGTGITLEQISFTNAPWLIPFFGVKDKSLANLLQLLVDTSQTLRDLITQISPSSTTFNTACLDGLPANPTKDDILAATISTICTLKSKVDSFDSTYVKKSQLSSLVNSILTVSPSGGSTVFNTRMIPFVAYEYYGPLSNFDNTGKGIVAAGFEKVYLCNGANGTPDKRGRVAVGSVRNVPGGALDAAVDPASSVNSIINVNYATGDKFGENAHKQTVAELPAHSHSITDPGHSHPLPSDGIGTQNLKSLVDSANNDEGMSGSNPTGSTKTNISIQSTGGGASFNVRQPSIAANFIMYIP